MSICKSFSPSPSIVACRLLDFRRVRQAGYSRLCDFTSCVDFKYPLKASALTSDTALPFQGFSGCPGVSDGSGTLTSSAEMPRARLRERCREQHSVLNFRCLSYDSMTALFYGIVFHLVPAECMLTVCPTSVGLRGAALSRILIVNQLSLVPMWVVTVSECKCDVRSDEIFLHIILWLGIAPTWMQLTPEELEGRKEKLNKMFSDSKSNFPSTTDITVPQLQELLSNKVKQTHQCCTAFRTMALLRVTLKSGNIPSWFSNFQLENSSQIPFSLEECARRKAYNVSLT